MTIDILLLSFLIQSDHNDLAKVLFVRLPSVPQPKVVAAGLPSTLSLSLIIVCAVSDSGLRRRFNSSWA